MRNVIKRSAFALAMLFACLPFAAPADDNYCHDPATERQWNRLALQYEEDAGIKYLYRLREDICAAIDAGHMTLRQGMAKFEWARKQIIRQKRVRNGQSPAAAGLG